MRSNVLAECVSVCVTLTMYILHVITFTFPYKCIVEICKWINILVFIELILDCYNLIIPLQSF